MSDIKQYLIAGNWKMNHGPREAVLFAQEIRGFKFKENCGILICPPFTAIEALLQSLRDSDIEVGAQNCYIERSGAYTGEISPFSLREMGCTYVIIGHSERRIFFNEKGNLLIKKITCATEANLRVIFCIGENLSQREKGGLAAKKAVISHLNILKRIPGDILKNIDIAYEPVWAIGTGKTASNEEIEEMHFAIKNFMRKRDWNGRLLYGGSVKPENAGGILRLKSVDGLLVGGASLNVESFMEIINCHY